MKEEAAPFRKIASNTYKCSKSDTWISFGLLKGAFFISHSAAAFPKSKPAFGAGEPAFLNGGSGVGGGESALPVGEVAFDQGGSAFSKNSVAFPAGGPAFANGGFAVGNGRCKSVAARLAECHTGRVRPMPSLVCFALKEEAAPFHKIAAGRPGVFTIIVGIGRQNAEKSVRSFLSASSPVLVLTCGFAGGLNPDLKLGDVVFDVQSPKSKVQSQLLAAGAKPAKIFCADLIATTVAEKKKLRDETGADAVEMESAAIHAVCAERGIPCATVRVISDPADEDLPLDFNALAKPDKNLDFCKLAWAIAKSPGKISALMRLQKKTSFAAQRLAAVLGEIIFP